MTGSDQKTYGGQIGKFGQAVLELLLERQPWNFGSSIWKTYLIVYLMSRTITRTTAMITFNWKPPNYLTWHIRKRAVDCVALKTVSPRSDTFAQSSFSRSQHCGRNLAGEGCFHRCNGWHRPRSQRFTWYENGVADAICDMDESQITRAVSKLLWLLDCCTGWNQHGFWTRFIEAVSASCFYVFVHIVFIGRGYVARGFWNWSKTKRT